MRKFNLIEELKSVGYTESVNKFGCKELSKSYSKTVDVAWYGETESKMTVTVMFNDTETAARACYIKNGCHEPFKIKNHLNEKRALNAIRQTVENNGYAL